MFFFYFTISIFNFASHFRIINIFMSEKKRRKLFTIIYYFFVVVLLLLLLIFGKSSNILMNKPKN